MTIYRHVRARAGPIFFILILVLAQNGFPRGVHAAEPIDIGSRLELFADDYLIERLTGDAGPHLHKPEPREVVLSTDKPWEGNTCGYFTIFQDDDLFRMYYRGSHLDPNTFKKKRREVTCYAESHDGIAWEKPNLGLFGFEGSKANNIVWDDIGTHCFTPFKDANPAAASDAQYKAVARGLPRGEKGLYVYKSPDGVHWSFLATGPVVTRGDFDSQNLAFWDAARSEYRVYHRVFRDGVRDIMTATSKDFVHWTEPEFLNYRLAWSADKNTPPPAQHLYTNAILPYARAPHLLLGFPTRYLPDEGERVEPTFMIGRDRQTFDRWLEAVIPEEAPRERSGNRSNYMAWGMVRAREPGAPEKLSVYATEGYLRDTPGRLRRFTYRLDGFVSIRAGAEGGEALTKPLLFTGKRLAINHVSKNGGAVRVGILDAEGKPYDGFSVDRCEPAQGDAVDSRVVWRGALDLSALAGKPVQLRFVLKNSDIYAFQFK